MAVNKALLRAVRSCCCPHMACRSFVTESLNKVEDLNEIDGAQDSKIRVSWDLQGCKVPVDHDAGNVIRNIRDALRGIHCNGPVEFWGYGDMTLCPPQTLSALHYGGVRLRHVPFGNDLQHQVMIADTIAWTQDHPPPAIHMLLTHLYLVPDSTRVYDTLGELEEQGYDILLVRPVPEGLTPSPAIDWPWETFLAEPKV